MKLWDAANGALIKESAGHNDFINTLEFSPDATKFVTSSMDKTAKIWDLNTGKVIRELKGHTSAIISTQLSPDGKTYIAATEGMQIKVWDMVYGKLKYTLRGHTNRINGVLFSPDGKEILSYSYDNTAKIWDVATGALLFDLKGHEDDVTNAVYNKDGTKVLTYSYDKTARVWDAGTGKLVAVLKGHEDKIWQASFSRDGTKVLTCSIDKTAKLWSAITGRVVFTLRGHRGEVNSAVFSADEKKIITASSDRTIKIWNADTGKEIMQLKGHTGGVFECLLSGNGKKLVTIGQDSSVMIWNIPSGKLMHNLKHHDFVHRAKFSADGNKIYTEAKNIFTWDLNTGALLGSIQDSTPWTGYRNFSNDEKKILVLSPEYLLSVWDIDSMKKLYSLGSHEGFILSGEFTPDDRKVISASNDNTCKVWFLSGKKDDFYTFFGIDENDYLVCLPSNYYFSSPDAVKQLHYVSKDLKIITFEQLDVKYNRPDLVLQAMGNKDTALINSYRKAYEKRIKKLGIDTSAFRPGINIPDADFANRNAIEYEQKRDKLQLRIKALDGTYNIDRFNIWINEIPLYGQRGISLRKRNKSSFDSSITISLSQGENRIETSITNVNGIESYRMPLLVNYTPATQQEEKTYFIGIGIDRFNNSKYNLKYSTKDIRDLAGKLKEKYKDLI
ncbi:MAG TPA: WD40 repeat domain-containing protein, partial [Ferruginibacter sp.]|nr:WD40 repeat domain-containing protein [Ferruginibacter sp.]